MSLAIIWFRRDLRLRDNAALLAAARADLVLPIFILDDFNLGPSAFGAASKWWLHHSLCELNASLEGRLAIYRGDPLEIIPNIIARNKATSIHWNRCYEPRRIARDRQVKEACKASGIEARSYNGSLLREPWESARSDRTPYKVFTPFYRRHYLYSKAPRRPWPAPERLSLIKDSGNSIGIEGLGLLPGNRWDRKLEPHWSIGESGAQEHLKNFIQTGLPAYTEERDFPAKPAVSKLSPHLAFGEISPNQVWHALCDLTPVGLAESYCRQLAWREYCYHLLYHFPVLPERNLQPKFDKFRWKHDDALLQRWQQGRTGFPLVDAGMRELWQTGYMHNRVRMIVASFLTKNLLIHWHHGERWFWDCLVDADLANNCANWQWVAGCGADAAPYFRIFSPTRQGQKFDPDGSYTKRFVPELSALPVKHLFEPASASDDMLNRAGVAIGIDYPRPIVNLAASRMRALESFTSL